MVEAGFAFQDRLHCATAGRRISALARIAKAQCRCAAAIPYFSGWPRATSDTVSASVREGASGDSASSRDRIVPIRTRFAHVVGQATAGLGSGSLALLSFLPDSNGSLPSAQRSLVRIIRRYERPPYVRKASRSPAGMYFAFVDAACCGHERIGVPSSLTAERSLPHSALAAISASCQRPIV